MLKILTLYSPNYIKNLVYILQNCEYQPKSFLLWWWHQSDYRLVGARKQLALTQKSKLLLLAGLFSALLIVLVGIILILQGYLFGILFVILYPIFVAMILALIVAIAWPLIVLPRQKKLIKQSEKVFAEFNGPIIAVLGSYGKTTMKELLAKLLSEKYYVAYTKGNLNVPVSHAKMASSLTGKEEILIIEYGESKPGDIEAFAKVTHPTHAFITGLAPAHLDNYKTLDAIAKDLLSIKDYVKPDNLYINSEPFKQNNFSIPKSCSYGHNFVANWQISNYKLLPTGTSFTIKDASKNINISTKLLGKHNIGPIAAAVDLALKLGVTNLQVQNAIAKIEPHKHRMKPYYIGGAMIIDDTYNGNIEGIKAGLDLLKELPAKRKIYITPGLVEQGNLTQEIHELIGKLIAKANPNIVVLMKNSTTKYITSGLQKFNYSGEVKIQDDPLAFYNNLEHFVANGDVVLMQNDWTDNYY